MDKYCINTVCGGFPGVSDHKESACNAGDLGLIPWSGRSAREGTGDSSILAWRIPWTEEPGPLQSMRSKRVRHTWETNGTFLMAQQVKNLLAMQETRVWSLGWGDSLEKEMATHSSILAWEILWTEEPGGLQSKGSQSRTWLSDWAWEQLTHTYHMYLWAWLFPPSLNPLRSIQLAVCLNSLLLFAVK